MTKLAAKLTSLFLVLIALLSGCHRGDQASIRQKFPVGTDTFKIDAGQDTLLTGSKGTAIFIEGGSFQFPDGSTPRGPLSLRLKECYGFSDIVREQLSTTADGRLLQTGGMVNVRVFAGDRELQLKKGKKLVLHFPKKDSARDMALFYADSSRGSLSWALDSGTLLKPIFQISGDWISGQPVAYDVKQLKIFPNGDTTLNVFGFLEGRFDMTALHSKNIPATAEFDASFTLTTKGKITKLRIKGGTFDTSGGLVAPWFKADPYVYEFFQGLPPMMPYADSNGKNIPMQVECVIHFSFRPSPPGYLKNENYNRLFEQKYAAFNNKSIHSMNDAELKYYIFSATKLGWINCDHFWDSPDEKIDYIVKAPADAKTSITLIFPNEKCIMAGVPAGDSYVFRNVPDGRDIKIVATLFRGSTPFMATATTKTTKQPFQDLEYKQFTLADLQSELDAR